MGRINRKMKSERNDTRQNPSPPSVPDFPSANLSGYRIPRVNRSPQREEYQGDIDMVEPEVPLRSVVHVPRERPRSSANHRSRRYSRSPRRPSREVSRRRNNDDLRIRVNRSRSRSRSPAERRIRFEDEDRRRQPARSHRHRSPIRRRSISRRPSINQQVIERIPIAARLGPVIAEEVPAVQIAERRITQVLKFEKVPTDVDLVSFLTLLSRSMRAINGATREFDYVNNRPGSSIFVYAIDQDEVDAAIGRGFSFDFLSGSQVISPLLIPATIVSVPFDKNRDPAPSFIPTIMLRGLVAVPARQAVTVVIEAAQAVVQTGAAITHVRVPGKDSSQKKTGSIAFVGLANPNQLHELDGYEFDRCAKKIPFCKSEQMPSLIATGLARRRPKDAEWTRRALQSNLLIARENPFNRV